MPKVALVVDDSMLIRYSICRFLHERGFAVESATNGGEALQVVSRILPDLIVTDMEMPNMSGSEFITALRANPQTAAIPIIVVTARASGFCESRERGDYAIYKDIDVDLQLAKALEQILNPAGKAKASGR